MQPKIPSCSDAPIWEVWLAAFHAPTLAIADELNLFGVLANEPLAVAELAARLNIELRATEAIAGLLASLGFLAFTDGRLSLSALARTYLLSDSPYYWGGLLRRIRETPLDCGKLIGSLRRGNAAQEAQLTELWQTAQPPPEALIKFTHAMHAHSFALAMRCVHLFELDQARQLLDVAGGSGSYSIAAAVQYPRLQCAVLDLPAVCGVAAEYASKHDVADRVRTHAADMFRDPWPTGHDVVLLSDIFHDWDDERCRQLARCAYESVGPGGRIMVHEMLLTDDKMGPLAAAAYSVVMVFVAQGRQRSEREIRAILESVGFVDIRVTETMGGYSLVGGTRAANRS